MKPESILVFILAVLRMSVVEGACFLASGANYKGERESEIIPAEFLLVWNYIKSQQVMHGNELKLCGQIRFFRWPEELTG